MTKMRIFWGLQIIVVVGLFMEPSMATVPVSVCLEPGEPIDLTMDAFSARGALEDLKNHYYGSRLFSQLSDPWGNLSLNSSSFSPLPNLSVFIVATGHVHHVVVKDVFFDSMAGLIYPRVRLSFSEETAESPTTFSGYIMKDHIVVGGANMIWLEIKRDLRDCTYR